ncbi:mannose-1-phosphate guanylyltransferase [Altererythrobacter sp. JGD-16]|uniref:Mannose-1-phosphate guanylyltransferase n=2 Tax=Altererythrobacter lutimaris TaxID=2743979 RepID=A0A850HF93_9SPHN|nr:mannose-1-phosphate guanylyltransferase [Altererythrobacter lutimaris]
MSEPLIYPVILCGGSGTRLWPRSRRSAPKPFIPLVGERTLFRAAIERASDPAVFGAPVIVAGAAHVGLIEAQLPESTSAQIVVEPAAKNTAPAIALAAAVLDPDAIMLVCPSDHHIADDNSFVAAARNAAQLAREDWLVAIGIAPERPETGYGYIKRGEALEGGHQVAQFVEKPELARAEAFLAEGGYAWNGGIFAFRAGALLDELAAHRPAMAEAVKLAVAEGKRDGLQFHPDADSFQAIEGDSIDYAVMENTARAAVVEASMGWSDIGNWAALQDALPKDSDGNHAVGAAEFKEARQVLAMSDGPRISVVGLDDICVIVDGNEVLVTSRDGAQLVGKLQGPAEG